MGVKLYLPEQLYRNTLLRGHLDKALMIFNQTNATLQENVCFASARAFKGSRPELTLKGFWYGERGYPDEEPYYIPRELVRYEANHGNPIPVGCLSKVLLENSAPILLLGIKGAGKTTEVLKIIYDCLTEGELYQKGILPCYVHCRDNASTTQEASYLRVFEQLAISESIPAGVDVEKCLEYSPPLLFIFELNHAPDELRGILAQSIRAFHLRYKQKHRVLVTYQLPRGWRDKVHETLMETGSPFLVFALQDINENQAQDYYDRLKGFQSQEERRRFGKVLEHYRERIGTPLLLQAMIERGIPEHPEQLITDPPDMSPTFVQAVQNYCEDIVKRYRGNEILAYYLEPDGRPIDSNMQSLLIDVVAGFISFSGNRAGNQMAILGEMGIGKTEFCDYLRYQMAESYLMGNNRFAGKIPAFFPLRNFVPGVRHQTFTAFLRDPSRNRFLRLNPNVTFDEWYRHVLNGDIVLILDGFDEFLLDRGSDRIEGLMRDNMRQITGGSEDSELKVILTCRTEYFKNQMAAEWILHRWNTWALIGFNSGKIVQYLEKRLPPNEFITTCEAIRNNENLRELCEIPLFLKLIVESQSQLLNDGGSPYELQRKLYENHLVSWVMAENSFRANARLACEERMEFLENLALFLYLGNQSGINYRELYQKIEDFINIEQFAPSGRGILDVDLRTNTLLIRIDAEGNYRFHHESFKEFFVARRLSREIQAGDRRNLTHRLASLQTLKFLSGFLGDSCNHRIEEWLNIREGALQANCMTLLGILNHQISSGISLAGANLDKAFFFKELPMKGFNLQGASLRKAVLRDCDFSRSDLSGADLTEADLTNTPLSYATLRGAILEKTLLIGTILYKADLQDASFVGVNVSGATFTCANVRGTRFRQTDFRSVGPIVGIQNTEEAILEE